MVCHNNELSVGGGGLISTTTIHNVNSAKVKKKKNIYSARREQFGIERKKENPRRQAGRK